MERLLFTSESVTEGHPDKCATLCQTPFLDALLEQDPMSRVAMRDMYNDRTCHGNGRNHKQSQY